jgi:hypothetical protein
MRFRQLDQLDGPQREQTGQFLSSSLLLYLISLLLTFHGFIVAQSLDTTSIFPLNTGDWTEFMIDNPTFFSSLAWRVVPSKTSLVREVLGDSLMSNGIIYKVVRWRHLIKSTLMPPPWYQYIRADDQKKIWGWGNNIDSLIYDFSRLDSGATWRVGGTANDSIYYERTIVRIRTENYFNKIRKTYDITLSFYCHGSVFKTSERFAEGLGIITFGKRSQSNCPDTSIQGSIWGGIISGRRHGETLAEKDNVTDYYPLHVGDSWRYKLYDADNPSLVGYSTRSVGCDTVFSDGFKYFGITDGYEYHYERIDSTGVIFYQRRVLSDWELERGRKLSLASGDTSQLRGLLSIVGGKFRDPQVVDTLRDRIVVDLTLVGFEYFSKFWGLSESFTEVQLHCELIGAKVNGKTWGDVSYLLDVEPSPIPVTHTISIDNYPNPFNNATVIRLQIENTAYSQLRIYNLMGQEVAAPYTGYLEVGKHNIQWSPQNLPSGVYIASLRTGGQTLTTKLLYLK